jgi:hypothetical protein
MSFKCIWWIHISIVFIAIYNRIYGEVLLRLFGFGPYSKSRFNALTVLNESLFFPFIAIMNSVMGLETCPHLTLIYLVLNVWNYLDAEVLNVI